MQDHSAHSRTFFARTNRLATQLAVNVEDLPEILGIKRRTLFDCRKDDGKVSGKSWSKLEEAERKASAKSASKCEFAESSAHPKDLEGGKSADFHEKTIPVVGWAHAGEAGSYEELPKDWQIRLPTDCPDRHAFAVILEGDSMEPKFSEGDWLIVQPSEVAYSGCLVVARFANDGVIFRRMERNGEEIILKPLNEGWPITRHRPEDFTWIYPVWGRFTPIWRKR